MGNLQDSVFTFFVEEAADHLNVLEAGLLHMEMMNSAGTKEDMEPLFRAAHTLKGAASLVKLVSVARISHRMEDIFEALRDGCLDLTSHPIDGLLFALDQIKQLIQLKVEGKDEPVDIVDLTLTRLNVVVQDAPSSTMTGPSTTSQRPSVKENKAIEEPVATKKIANKKLDFTGHGGAERRELGRRVEETTVGIRVGLGKIEELMGLVGEVTVVKNHLVDQVKQVGKMRQEIEFIGQRLLREVTQFADRYDYTLPTQPALQEQTGDDDFQELEFDRYDELNLFSRKLREITNDADEGMRGLSNFFTVFGRDVSDLDRMTDEIKERISEVRTVPAGTLFQRFNRSVRDMARERHQEVELFVSGGETLIDRVVYDGLFDPLLHILRNCFAHGIESIDERKKRGKAEKATIRMTAERRGNTVEISVSDDGRGIDLVRVRKRAIEKGFITTDTRLSERDLMQIIFRPGFSTTDEVNATSGRGVGMNVVMDRLASLNGTIDIETFQGQGSTFRLRLPLSLVIINVIRFEVAGQLFVLPSTLVTEIQDLSYEKAQRTQAEEMEAPPEQVNLRELFGLPNSEISPAFGILTQSEGIPVQLLVDRVLGQEDTVIKPFGAFLQETPYFSGTSLAGDGSTRLVVNPVRMKYRARSIADSFVDLSTARSEKQKSPTVLIVDDSLSVRKYASMLLAGKGLKILTAADGLEALALLEHEEVDSIITDLEMPHMHGYDLLAELQRRPDWQVPIAVLSSRAGEQHQQKAIKLGATDYLIKPFEEETLMAVVKKHLAICGRSL